MAKPLLIAIVLIVCFSFVVKAQSDTSTYDLGRILVKKQFTQSITVKAHDLEQYPFSDLAEAINVWFYGTYSNASTLVYVIDGNIINDVNAYSIYDIDEITLVQNALGQVSGASPGQQLVLIKLKTDKPGKQGIEAAGQTNLINTRSTASTEGEKSSSGLYNQYYVSGYKNFENFSLGLSADYQHDAVPLYTNSSYASATPYTTNILKLNFWGKANVWTGTTVTLGLNFVPQVSSFADSYLEDETADLSISGSDNGRTSQHLLNSTIAVKSHIIDGLTNSFSAAYNFSNFYEKAAYDYNSYSDGSIFNESSQYLSIFNKTSNLLIRENLAYSQKLGDFDIEPALNFSYRSVHNVFDYGIANFSQSIPVYANYTAIQQFQNNLLTPTVNVVYKNFLNLQVGVMAIVSPDKYFTSTGGSPGISPFVTASADISKLLKFSDAHLKVFGSFSQQNQVLDDQYASLSGSTLYNNLVNSLIFTTTSNGAETIASSPISNPNRQYNNFQGGVVLSFPKNFTINYSFEYRNYETLFETEVPIGENDEQLVDQYLNDKTITNRLGFNYYLSSNSFSWKTGINTTESKLSITGPFPLTLPTNPSYLSSGNRVSGGFTNRFVFNTLFAGIDVLYQIGERPISLVYPYVPVNTNSISIQNLYIGSEIKLPYLKYAKVFLNGRNILQNKASDITDNNRFFGIGFKAGL